VSTPSTRDHLVKGGFVALDVATGAIERIVAFQYNPQQLVHGVSAGAETFSLVAEYDAAGALEVADPVVVAQGIGPQLAALRGIVMAPTPSALAFVWGPARVAPVEVLSLVVTETAFDAQLHPLGASAAIELRVLNAHGGLIGQLGAAYAREQLALAALAPPATLDELGTSGVG
jgi:hypothetical protein